jgi:glycosyltransferase involved in cell wall biosynthesis
MTNTLSIIIPVYNRPHELLELLNSLSQQSDQDFEVVIVEDGSTDSSKDVVENYRDQLDIQYFEKPNSGPGQSRNYGCDRAKGDYFIFLDSDCLVPESYIETVKLELKDNYVDAFGGPDRAHESFDRFQKAISYSMTSFFTTGGIRGASEKIDKFYPRSFNMGISREVYQQTRGFSKMRFGEDIDLSMRILSNGFRTRLIKEAFVYHKRRSTFKQFYKQVYNSGIARINLTKRHPGTLKWVHFMPAILVLSGILVLVMSICWTPYVLILPFIYLSLLFIDGTIKHIDIITGFYCIATSIVQIMGYGLGFMEGLWKRVVLGKSEFAAFEKNFYK